MSCCQKKYLLPALVIAALVAWYAYAYHQPHLAAALPFLIILACPLMHLVMMGGHGEKKHEKETHDKKSCH